MGVTFENRVAFTFTHLTDDVTNYFQSLEDQRLPAAHCEWDVPVYEVNIQADHNTVEINSGGYGVFDLAQLDLPDYISDNLKYVTSLVRSRQSDDLDYIRQCDGGYIKDVDWCPDNQPDEIYYNLRSKERQLERMDEVIETALRYAFKQLQKDVHIDLYKCYDELANDIDLVAKVDTDDLIQYFGDYVTDSIDIAYQECIERGY